MKSNYVVSFDYFRVFAILLIVLGHSLSKSFQLEYPLISNIIKGGGSLLFVFISGYLFHILLPRYNSYSNFISSKFKKLVVPYILFSVPLILFRHIEKNSNFYNTDLGLDKSIYPLVSLINGAHMTGYWYIPAIILFFILSFRFIKYFSTMEAKARYSIIFLLSSVSSFIHRPIDNFNTLHSVLYIIPFFLIGVSFSIDRKHIISIKRKKIILCAATTAFLCINYYQSYIQGHIGNYHKPFFQYDGFDLNFIKFLIITPVIYLLFEQNLSKRSELVRNLANTSFVLYFTHPIFISALNTLGITSHLELQTGLFFTLFVIFIFTTSFCCIFYYSIRFILGKKFISILGG